MEQISLDELNRDLTKQLESVLTRLAVASESHLSTYKLEDKAKKLASKLRASVEVFSGLAIYKGVSESSEVYNPEIELNDYTFVQYAYLSKKNGEALDLFKVEGSFFAKISDNLYVNIGDIPEQTLPQFKVKIEGNTLMAVRGDLLEKLPSGIKKMLTGGGIDE